MRKRRETFLSLQLPYRDRLRLERTIYEGAAAPRVAVVSGVHGDELEGLYVCHLLAEWLEAAERQELGALSGRIELYPALNPLGVETGNREVPLYAADLNRSFPGHRHGLLPQRLADAVLKALQGCSLVIDIHAGTSGLRETPQVRLNNRYRERLMPLAEALGVDVIWCLEAHKVLDASLSHSLNSTGVPCLVVEMGAGKTLTPVYAKRVTNGILRACQRLQVVAGSAPLPTSNEVARVIDDSNLCVVRAEGAGLFVPFLEAGQPVALGDVIGTIVSAYEGNTKATVRASVDGYLFSLREYPLVYEGTLLARIAGV